jgi:photosystem II stability/assembly factor-like uncharacterized protein
MTDMQPNPRFDPHRRPPPCCLAAVTALAFGLALAGLAVGPGASAQGALWQPVIDGLYGDRVVTLVLVGRDSLQNRPLILLPQDHGLFRSPDGGETWAPVSADPNRPGAVVLAAARAHADDEGERLYAGLRFVPVFSMSEDGGQTWTPRAGPAGLSRMDRLTASRSGRVYAGDRGTAATLWSSTNHGESWERHELGPEGITGRIDDLFAAPDDPVVYLISGQTLYRSNDDPSAWTAVLGPKTTPAVAVSHAAIGPRGRLYAAGRRASDSAYTVMASPDRGDTWPIEGWPDDAADVAPRALAGGEPTEAVPVAWLALENGQIFQSEDVTTEWRRLRTLPVPPTSLVADPANKNVWAGSDGLGLFLTDPAWDQTGAVPVEALAIVAPNYSVDRMVYLNARIRPERRDGGNVLPALHAMYQATAGETWTRIDNTQSIGDNLLASPDFARDKRLYSGQVVSHDKGATWEPLPRTPNGLIPSIAAVGPLTRTQPVVYALEEPYAAGTGGRGLVRSEDGGQNWEMANADVSGIVDVAVSPAYADDRTVFFGTERGIIYRAVDGLDFDLAGRIPALAPQRTLYDLVLSPGFRTDQTLFAAIEDSANPDGAAVHVSSNGGENWPRRASGLSTQSRPRTLILSPNFSADRVIFLGGERRDADPPAATIYGSDAAGAEWFAETVLPQPATVHAFAWGGTLFSGRLFAAAGPAGVWMRLLDGPPDVPDTPTPSSTPTPSTTPTPSPSPTGATPTPTATDPSASPSPTQTPTGDPSAATPTITSTATPTGDGGTAGTPTSGTPMGETPTAGTPASETATATAATPTANTPTPTATQLTPSPSPTATATPGKKRIYLPLAFRFRLPRR